MNAYNTVAPLHLINLKSVNKIKKYMEDKYKGDDTKLALLNAETENFRANFIVDHDFENTIECEEGPTNTDTMKMRFPEDEFAQMRVGNLMFRQVGPCARCKTTTIQWGLNNRHPDSEPFVSISEVRRHP